MAIQRKQIVERGCALLKIGFAFSIIGLLGERAHTASEAQQPTPAQASETAKSSPALIADGQRVFRFDTFGDEELWTDKLRLHVVVEKSVDLLRRCQLDSRLTPTYFLLGSWRRST